VGLRGQLLLNGNRSSTQEVICFRLSIVDIVFPAYLCDLIPLRGRANHISGTYLVFWCLTHCFPGPPVSSRNYRTLCPALYSPNGLICKKSLPQELGGSHQGGNFLRRTDALRTTAGAFNLKRNVLEVFLLLQLHRASLATSILLLGSLAPSSSSSSGFLRNPSGGVSRGSHLCLLLRICAAA
jgi:hypothetical protein